MKLTAVIRPRQGTGDLTAEEGFLFSRISGEMPVKDVLALCPWPEEKALNHLKALIEKTCVEVLDDRSEATSQVSEADPYAPILAEDEKNANLKNLDRPWRREILTRFSLPPSENAYEVLEVSIHSSEKEIKERYLSLSRKFHPDRFFGKELGHYKQKLELIFSRIQKAYASLKDPYTREALKKKIALQKPSDAKSSNEKAKKNLKDKALKLDPQMERIFKAEKYFQAGLEQKKAGDFIAAANSFNLAYQTNKEREHYLKAYEDVQPFMIKQRASQQLESARNAMKLGIKDEALTLAEQILRRDPDCHEARMIAGRAILEMGFVEKFRDAKEMLLRAKAGLPKSAEACYLLAKALHVLGDKKAAKRECQEALKREPNHQASKSLLEDL